MSAALKDDIHLTNTLILARQSIVASIGESGPCDHDVGICVCADKSLIERIDNLLIKTFGFNLPWTFYHAAPNEPEEEKVKRGKIGRDLLLAHVRENFAEIEERGEPVF